MPSFTRAVLTSLYAIWVLTTPLYLLSKWAITRLLAIGYARKNNRRSRKSFILVGFIGEAKFVDLGVNFFGGSFKDLMRSTCASVLAVGDSGNYLLVFGVVDESFHFSLW